MTSIREIARGVALSWAGTFMSIVAGFIMAPFLVHHLGTSGYGVWVLIQSTVAYMQLTDLGLRTSLIRFVARDYAISNHNRVSQIVSAALLVRATCAIAVMAILSFIAGLLSRFHSLPHGYAGIARTALLLIGGSFASTLVFSVFTATLFGIGAFALVAVLELSQTVLTTMGLIPIVQAGYGIIGMACWYFLIVLTINIIMTIICFRRYPQLTIAVTHVPERDLLKALWSVGMYVLGFNIADQLIVYSDNLVVGAFISAAAVAYYAVAGRMVIYLRQIATAILKYLMPVASGLDARGRQESLRELHIRSTQLVLLVTLPVVATLYVRGGTFLRLWIGADFQRSATPVLKILIATTAFVLSNAGLNGLAIALGRQKWLTAFALIEGFVNLMLSIALARSIGLVGVALGTAIPSIVMQAFVWPLFARKLLALSWIELINGVWVRPGLAIIPFVTASYFAELYWPVRNLSAFVGQVLLALPIALAGAALVFRTELPSMFGRLRLRS